jgi:chaperone required for assembly of F1-ATPase
MTETKTTPRPRRFYTSVQVAPTSEGGFAITLDDRKARTPGARPLILPTEGLAVLIQEEWSAQGDILNWTTMPATRLAGLTLDGDEGARSRAVQIVTDYAGSDLICYFAPAPRSLVARQVEVWGSLLTWAEEAHGLAFRRAAGIMHHPQPASTLSRLVQLLSESDDFTLSGLALAAPLFGSAVIAMALAHQHFDATAAVAAARLDEIFQESQWGVDQENARRVEALATEARWLGRWFAALR